MAKKKDKKKKNRKIMRKRKGGNSLGLRLSGKKNKKFRAGTRRRVQKKTVKKRTKKVKKQKPKKESGVIKKKIKAVKKSTRRFSKRKKIKARPKLKLKKRGKARPRGIRYSLNPRFHYVDELKDLILKSSPEEKEKMTDRLLRLGRVKLAVATGIFLNKVNAEAVATDLFIVGDDINRRRLRSFLKSLEADIGKEVRYVVMEKEEFQYRIGMFDRFIRVLLEGPHEKLINRLGI